MLLIMFRKFTEGYRITKLLETKINHLIYVDDIRIFAKSFKKYNPPYKLLESSAKIEEWNLE